MTEKTQSDGCVELINKIKSSSPEEFRRILHTKIDKSKTGKNIAYCPTCGEGNKNIKTHEYDLKSDKCLKCGGKISPIKVDSKKASSITAHAKKMQNYSSKSETVFSDTIDKKIKKIDKLEKDGKITGQEKSDATLTLRKLAIAKIYAKHLCPKSAKTFRNKIQIEINKIVPSLSGSTNNKSNSESSNNNTQTPIQDDAGKAGKENVEQQIKTNDPNPIQDLPVSSAEKSEDDKNLEQTVNTDTKSISFIINGAKHELVVSQKSIDILMKLLASGSDWNELIEKLNE